MTYPLIKKVCQLNEQGIYVGQTHADLSPEEAENGVYLMPAGCVDVAPPEEKEGFVAKWTGDEWQYIENHIGKTVYLTATKEPMEIGELGAIPQGYTSIKPESEHEEWNGNAWVIPPEKLTALLQQRRTNLLKAIADKTDNFKAQYLIGYSQAEIDSFYRQEREARDELPTMLLTEIFEGRDDLSSIDDLKKKVIEKADLFAIIMGKLFAIKQGFEKHIEQAETMEQLDKIEQEINQWQKL
ncbi:hypothetical protein [Aggregatibacter actinomycetemcomitans]|uniref:hypothetical protein n=1 Tax=Aggregatibacter actinomycetemcomitans TaxID=714 RepID=UPI001F11F52D|nr:hypothetical protein [Aggregatibacter actinomycetemcomitans]